MEDIFRRQCLLPDLRWVHTWHEYPWRSLLVDDQLVNPDQSAAHRLHVALTRNDAIPAALRRHLLPHCPAASEPIWWPTGSPG
eukprot:scaffold2266_cov166-Ochromonas_danica.AAC.16